jgi:putative methionine-R-sulfoxide reductase with GAF domain
MQLAIMQYGRRQLLAYLKLHKEDTQTNLADYLPMLYQRIGDVIYLVLYYTTCNALGFRPFDGLGTSCTSKTCGLKLHGNLVVIHLVKSELRGLFNIA